MSHTTLSASQELAQVTATIEALQLRKAELEAIVEAEFIAELDAMLVEEKAPVATKTKGASRVKRSKKVDAIVESVKGKRDINAGDKAKIDATKEAAAQFKPEKVQQEKRSAKPKAEKASKSKEKRTHEGMSYSEVRKQVSERKAKLNKADQERMAKAGLKNNTWDTAIESLAWLDKYFPAK